jgi:hypothetical protein
MTQHPSQEVAPDEAAQAGQEMNHRLRRDFPTQRFRSQGLQIRGHWLEWTVGKRFDGQSTEQVMHDRITDDHNPSKISVRGLHVSEEFVDQFAYLTSDQPGQRSRPVLSYRKLDPTHDVRAMACLLV